MKERPRRIADFQMLVDVGVSRPHLDQGGRAAFTALVDTGAQRTLITESVAKQIGIEPVGQCTIKLGNGATLKTVKYSIDLCIKMEFVEEEFEGDDTFSRSITLYEVPQLLYRPEKYAVVLGMDVLSRCNFSMQPEGTFSLTLRPEPRRFRDSRGSYQAATACPMRLQEFQGRVASCKVRASPDCRPSPMRSTSTRRDRHKLAEVFSDGQVKVSCRYNLTNRNQDL